MALRLFDLAFESLALLVERKKELVRLCRVPAMILFVVYGAQYYILFSARAGNYDEYTWVLSSYYSVLLYLFYVILYALFVLIVIMWHRYLILGERVWSNTRQLMAMFIIYFLYSLFIGVLLLGSYLPLILLAYILIDLGVLAKAAAIPGFSGFVRLVLFFFGVGGLIILLKCSLVLVDRAVGRRTGGIGWSWRITRPVLGQLFGVAAVVYVLQTAGGILVNIISSLTSPPTLIAVPTALISVATVFLEAFVVVCAMSLIYRELVLNAGDEGEPVPNTQS